MFFDRYEGDWNALLQTLFSADIKKVSHHVKDLMRLLRENNLPAEGFVFDTALAAYLLDATAGSYELERLFVAYFNEELPQPLYREKDAFSMLGDTVQAEASFESYTTAVEALYEPLREELEQAGMHALFYDIELPLCAVLADMERAGCRVDAVELTKFGEEMAARTAEKEQNIYAMAGEAFNMQFPKAVGSDSL